MRTTMPVTPGAATMIVAAGTGTTGSGGEVKGRLSADGRDLSSLQFGQTTPDPEGLTDPDGVLGTGLSHRADLADGLGALLSALSLIFSFKGRRGEEQVGMIATAKRPQLPLIRQPHRVSLSGRQGAEGTQAWEDPPGKFWNELDQFSRSGSTSTAQPLTATTATGDPALMPASR